MDEALQARLNRMFYPSSIAVIGAGNAPDKVGHAIMDSIITGGFKGRIYPVHPRHESVLGLPVFRSLDRLPEVPDLAVVALNQYSTVQATRALSEMGVGGASIIAGGYAEMGEEGRQLQNDLQVAAGDMPVVGPNTLGFLNTWADLNVTFYPRVLRRGMVSFLSQSGGIGLALKGKADDEGLGFSKWIGVGNRVNLEFHTLLEFLANDPHTNVIGIFAEGCSDPRKLMSTIRSVTEHKPVIFYKGGRGKGADRVTISHTGAAAGEDAIWNGALIQAGAEVVYSAPEMIAVCKALSIARRPEGKKIGIFTHTAGPSIVAWDILQEIPGCELSNLKPETLDRIAEILGPSVPVVYKNPVDGAAGAFLAAPYHDIAEAILADPSVDVLLAIFCEHKNWPYPSDALIDLAKKYPKPIIACFIGTVQKIEPNRRQLHEAGVPTYVMPEEAAHGLAALLKRTP
jgi:acetyltransferase